VKISGGTVAVTLSRIPPPGSVSQVVLYAGITHAVPSNDDPTVSFPAVDGEDIVYAAGVTAGGKRRAPSILACRLRWPPTTRRWGMVRSCLSRLGPNSR
jgi:hypothetical protein